MGGNYINFYACAGLYRVRILQLRPLFIHLLKRDDSLLPFGICRLIVKQREKVRQLDLRSVLSPLTLSPFPRIDRLVLP